jgi:hypothetical protein
LTCKEIDVKIVINNCFGGFGLSPAAWLRYSELKGGAPDDEWDIARDDPALVQVVEELGSKSWGDHAELKVVEIPDSVRWRWRIEEYDGIEHIAEAHRTWS